MANLSAHLMGILRCPVTGAPLVQRDAVLEAASKEALANPNSGPAPKYRIVEGIPVLLRTEQLTVADDAGTAAGGGSGSPALIPQAQPEETSHDL